MGVKHDTMIWKEPSVHPDMIAGLTEIESSRARWDTLIEILKETRPTQGRMQVYIVREMQKGIVALID